MDICQYQNKKNGRAKSGFSLIEVLLVVAIVSLIGGIGIPVFQSFQVKHSLGMASTSLVHSIRRAQVLANSASGDSDWGVKINTGSIIIFQGSSYVSRNIGQDEISEISPTIDIAGLNEVIFSAGLGVPQSTGSVTLTNVSGDSLTVVLNEKGMVSN